MMTFGTPDDSPEPRGSATLAPKLPSLSCRAAGWTSAAMGVVIFIAGGICGAAAVRMAPSPKPMSSLSELPQRTAERLQRDLKLSDAQTRQIEEIVRQHQPELHRIRVRIAPEMRTALGLVIDEVSGVLTPEQDKRFRPHAEHKLDVHFPPEEAARQSTSN